MKLEHGLAPQMTTTPTITQNVLIFFKTLLQKNLNLKL